MGIAEEAEQVEVSVHLTESSKLQAIVECNGSLGSLGQDSQ